jgi:hypothetical protein
MHRIDENAADIGRLEDIFQRRRRDQCLSERMSKRRTKAAA